MEEFFAMRNASLISGMVIFLSIAGCSVVQRFTVVPQAEAAIKKFKG